MNHDFGADSVDVKLAHLGESILLHLNEVVPVEHCLQALRESLGDSEDNSGSTDS